MILLFNFTLLRVNLYSPFFRLFVSISSLPPWQFIDVFGSKCRFVAKSKWFDYFHRLFVSAWLYFWTVIICFICRAAAVSSLLYSSNPLALPCSDWVKHSLYFWDSTISPSLLSWIKYRYFQPCIFEFVMIAK